MSKIRETEGIPWSNGTISNCVYTGVRVSDVLEKGGLPTTTSLHVEFANHAPVEEDSMFASSVPLAKAMDESTILAYEMNHEPLARDHGYPVRVIIPGYAGARSVKWLDSITVQRSEATNFYMQRDYKVLPAEVKSRDRHDMEKIWSSVPALQEMGVQSAICSPRNGETVVSEDGGVDIKGYAVAGEDGPIKAVRVSTDQGKTWNDADITYQEGKYSWTLWKYRLHKVTPSTKIWSRAESASGILQPILPPWNLRGVMSNGVDQITNLTIKPHSHK
jgi:sulfite oxidase